MKWIFISPHLDDAALSVGGLVWEFARGENIVEVWTVFSGDPPEGGLSPFAESLHRRWKTGRNAMEFRREEDKVACGILSARWRHLGLAECIYRKVPGTEKWMYDTEETIFGPLHESDAGGIQKLTEIVSRGITVDSVIVCPLAIGNHVDHQMTRAAVEALRCTRLYYADYPYVMWGEPTDGETLSGLVKWELTLFPISQEGLSVWKQSIAAYRSQLSTFWSDQGQMETAIEVYCAEKGGVQLWVRTD